ncbi:MAG: selenocysteine-specific translation elongation factor [Oscillospiraceae bacterium]|nr:selenocysteine-specific translation elongation factor [Oscillospiraceae bacterium]
MKHIILGTAGHVDHGKTTLVKRLTGVDTDRLKEEKARGITIELGFAPFTLPNGQHMGIVDVPGHEKFVKNMLSGSTGIDLVLFVIAADEGVMPQTREHMDILRLLHVNTGVVALTKIDMVDPEWLELVREDTAAFVAESPLAGAKILEVSAVTGEGIDALIAELERLGEKIQARSVQGGCRLAIDRVFTLSGFGTVVTGTMWRGTIRTGQTVEVFPAELKARVRSLQVHGEKRSEASAGERVAVNLVGLEKSQVERGSWLSEPDALHNTFRLDVRLELLPSAPELEQRTRVHVHHGTEEVLARVNLLDRDTLLPGETCFAQLELESPLCPLAGDRVVLRFYSPVFTIGGGVVLDPDARKHKRFSESVTERLDALMSNDPGQVLLASMDQDNSPWPVARGAACLDVDESEVRKIMDPLLESGELLSLSEGLYISRSSWERLCVSLRAWLEDYCSRFPLRQGAPAADALNAVCRSLTTSALRALTLQLESAPELELRDGLLCIRGYRPTLDPKLAGRMDAVRKALNASPLSPPAWSEITPWPDMSAKDRSELLLWFVRQGEVIKAADDVVFPAAALRAAEQTLRAATGESFTLAEARDALNTSRKYTLYILDWLCGEGKILRNGDLRIWK